MSKTQMRQTIAAQRQYIAELEALINECGTALRAQEERIATLVADVGPEEQRIATFVANADSRLDRMETRLDQLANRGQNGVHNLN